MPGGRRAGPCHRGWVVLEIWTVKASDPRANQASWCLSLRILASACRIAGKEVLHQRIIHVEGGGGECARAVERSRRPRWAAISRMRKVPKVAKPRRVASSWASRSSINTRSASSSCASSNVSCSPAPRCIKTASGLRTGRHISSQGGGDTIQVRTRAGVLECCHSLTTAGGTMRCVKRSHKIVSYPQKTRYCSGVLFVITRLRIQDAHWWHGHAVRPPGSSSECDGHGERYKSPHDPPAPARPSPASS
jgi:hypothetical protein